MPTLLSSSAEVTRRAVLTSIASGAGAALAGCTVSDTEQTGARRGAGTSSADPRPDPDVALAAAALMDERHALDALKATVARHRDLRRTLSPMIEAHRAHVSLLAEAAPDDPLAPESPSLPGLPPTPFRVPRDARLARNRLATLELTLSTSAKRHSFSAESGAFARVLASLAGAAAQQAAALSSRGARS